LTAYQDYYKKTIMNAIDISLIILFGSITAGLIGALSGLGGGIIIVPLLVIGLGVDIHYAIGSSLIAVIATSTAASCAYVKEGFTNVRLAILLETATTIGAILGVGIASLLPASLLSLIFGLFLLYVAVSSLYQAKEVSKDFASDRLALTFKLNSTYPTSQGMQNYPVHHLPLGYLIMFIAGAVSGILGIGSGALKVLALDRVMGLPFKVSTTTSNFMIGVTAATSAGLYFNLGYIDPLITMPVAVGVTFGAFIGARLLPSMSIQVLRRIFSYAIILVGLQMILKTLGI
jgi:uncharacterized membrane protein YfcA